MSGPVFFISDLHLDPDTRPATVAMFRAFLRGPARAAERLYVLGDLFEAWVGDDDDHPGHVAILAELKALAAAGVATAFLAGNRDFLAGTGFAARSGCRVLADPTRIDLHGVPTLVTHGDLLCTDDTEHLAFRARMARPEVRRELLARPLAERRAEGRALRRQSEARKRRKSDAIMDVNANAVDAALADSAAELLIHGHTHRPALHGDPVERIVLGDWDETAVILAYDGDARLELQELHPDMSVAPLGATRLPDLRRE